MALQNFPELRRGLVHHCMWAPLEGCSILSKVIVLEVIIRQHGQPLLWMVAGWICLRDHHFIPGTRHAIGTLDFGGVGCLSFLEAA